MSKTCFVSKLKQENQAFIRAFQPSRKQTINNRVEVLFPLNFALLSSKKSQSKGGDFEWFPDSKRRRIQIIFVSSRASVRTTLYIDKTAGRGNVIDD